MKKRSEKRDDQVTDFSGKVGDRFFRKLGDNNGENKRFGRGNGGFGGGNEGIVRKLGLGKLNVQGQRFSGFRKGGFGSGLDAHKLLFIALFIGLFLISSFVGSTILSLTFSSTSNLVGWQDNRTEGTALGERLHAPVLFMDFEELNGGTKTL